MRVAVLRGRVVPIDPGREWLAAGITGLQRQREWDAVATAEADAPGDEIEFVALPDGSLVVESGEAGVDPQPFADALGDDIEAPYRALAVKRPELWAVGAVAIEVERLDPDPRGDELELTWTGSELALTIDERPAEPAQGAALERIASQRIEGGAYAAHAHRLRGDLWELSILPL